jgi:hypothetical protein
VRPLEVGELPLDMRSSARVEYKEAFALFDKKGTGAVPRETLGDQRSARGCVEGSFLICEKYTDLGGQLTTKRS